MIKTGAQHIAFVMIALRPQGIVSGGVLKWKSKGES